jgi:hypothetical protein
MVWFQLHKKQKNKKTKKQKKLVKYITEDTFVKKNSKINNNRLLQNYFLLSQYPIAI